MKKTFFLLLSLSLIIIGCQKSSDNITKDNIENQLKKVDDVENKIQTQSQNQPSLKEEASEPVVPDPIRTEEDVCNLEYRRLLDKYAQEYNDCMGDYFTIECEGEESNREGVRKQDNLILIMDSSGSMAGRIGGVAKIDIAKEAANKFINSISEKELNVGLMVYGHKGNNTYAKKQESCLGIDEVYKLGKVDLLEIKSAINTLKATGWTPIDASLEKAKNILNRYPSDQYNNTVLLFSDGEETCEGSPIEKAKELKSLDYKIDVIGFDVFGAAEEQLKKVAEAGGGKYYPARSVEELNSAFSTYDKTYCYGVKKYAWGQSKSQLDVAWAECKSRLAIERGDFATAYDKEVSRECYPFVSGRYNERVESIQTQIQAIREEGLRIQEMINPSVD